MAVWQIYRYKDQTEKTDTSEKESKLPFIWRHLKQQRQCKSPNLFWKKKGNSNILKDDFAQEQNYPFSR